MINRSSKRNLKRKKPKESKEVPILKKQQQIIPSSSYFSCGYCDKTYQQEIKKKTRIKMYARQFKRTEENKKQV